MVLPQGRRVSSSKCCAEPYPMLMRSSISRLRRWSRPLLFAPDLQRRAPQPQCCKTRRRLRGKTPVESSQSQCSKTRRRLRGKTAVDARAFAVGRVRVKSQCRSFRFMTANITSWGSGRHYLEQERPSLVVIQEHHLAQADSITEAQSWFSLQPSPMRMAMARRVGWLL